MKRLSGILLCVFVFFSLSEKATHAQNIGGYLSIKSNTQLDLGFDVGVTFLDKFGIKVGMMSDVYHPSGNDNQKLEDYKDALGKDYRLSYTAGPMVKIIDWLWLSAVVGYGEYGTYGYSDKLEMYGISNKIKGLEAGAQLRFVFGLVSVEAGYGTVPKGFSLGRPFHDIVLGLGFDF